MKLIRFTIGDTMPSFGIVVGDRAVSFSILQHRSGITKPGAWGGGEGKGDRGRILIRSNAFFARRNSIELGETIISIAAHCLADMATGYRSHSGGL
jgi:hypothetical protein